MKPPTITILQEGALVTRYRLEGGDMDARWAPPEGKLAWCEISVWNDDPGRVSTYGGEVWPTAWSRFFKVLLPSQGGRGLMITDEGQRLLASAKVLR